MPSMSPVFGFYEPLVNDPTDQDLWGGYLNANFTTLDGLIKTAMNFTPVAETASFTITAPTVGSSTLGSTNAFYCCDATAGAVVGTLPAASASIGMRIGLKKVDASANQVSFLAVGSDKIDGATTNAIAVQYDAVIICSDGTNWQIIATITPPLTGIVKSQKRLVLTTNQTYTPSANFLYGFYELVGGGAGGAQLGGGGGAETQQAFFTAAQIGASQPLTLGTGGPGATANAGNNGGDSTFGALLTAKGGHAATAIDTIGAGGRGGAGGVSIPGGDGGWGTFNKVSNINLGGTGGGSFYGQGTPAASCFFSASSLNGLNASNYGAGGSGGTTGGNGAGGVMYVTEFLSV